MSRLRLVLDTNVVVSAVLWRGNPGRLLEIAGEQEVRLFTSKVLLDELSATLIKKKLLKYVASTGFTPGEILGRYKRVTSTIVSKPLSQRVSRDIDDDAVLACASASKADLIGTGDDDLLVLGSFEGIEIVTVAAAIKQLGGI